MKNHVHDPKFSGGFGSGLRVGSKFTRSNENAFGGKLVVLGGDFRQILPVVAHGSRESIVAATVRRASFWNDCRVMHLRINMRLRTGDQSDESTEKGGDICKMDIASAQGEV